MLTSPAISISSIASELIQATELFSPEVLQKAHVEARKLGIPFGRILVMSGYLAEGDLTAILQAARSIKEDILAAEQVLPLLKSALRQGLPFEQVACIETKQRLPNLAKFLLAAKILCLETITDLLELSEHKGLPFGPTLVSKGVISADDLKTAIDCLILVRGRCISQECAAKAMRSVYRWKYSLSEALAQLKIILPSDRPRLEELLQKASVIEDVAGLAAAEISIETGKPISEVLFELGLVPPLTLKVAMRLQSMLSSGHLIAAQAQELLHQVNIRQLPVETLLNLLAELQRFAMLEA